MPRTCSICRHQKRGEIDANLLRGDTFRHIAAQFRVSTGALQRHRNSCISEQLEKAKEVSDVAAGSALVREIQEITRKTRDVLTRAMAEKNGDLALKAIARLERQLELKGRLLGQLQERNPGAQRIEVVYIDKAVIVPGNNAKTDSPATRAGDRDTERALLSEACENSQ